MSWERGIILLKSAKTLGSSLQKQVAHLFLKKWKKNSVVESGKGKVVHRPHAAQTPGA